MKIKLLKEIRERYEIVLVTKTGTKSIYSDITTQPPFYLLRDNHYFYREWFYREYFHPDLEQCLRKLSEWIHKDYSNQSTRDRWTEKKVWHTNNK